MNIDTVRDRKELLLREIEKDRYELQVALQDLRDSVSVARQVRVRPKTWVLGAFVAGFIAGELI